MKLEWSPGWGLLASEGWQGTPAAGGTQAEPAWGSSALWVTQNTRGKITLWLVPWFHWLLAQVNLEVQSNP